jgi:hypothetical protein
MVQRILLEGFAFARIDKGGARHARGRHHPAWNLNDLRPTAATGMARLNFPPQVVAKATSYSRLRDARRSRGL